MGLVRFKGLVTQGFQQAWRFGLQSRQGLFQLLFRAFQGLFQLILGLILACGTCTQYPFKEVKHLISVKFCKTQCRLRGCSILNALTLEKLRAKIDNCALLLGFFVLSYYTARMPLISRISPGRTTKTSQKSFESQCIKGKEKQNVIHFMWLAYALKLLCGILNVTDENYR